VAVHTSEIRGQVILTSKQGDHHHPLPLWHRSTQPWAFLTFFSVPRHGSIFRVRACNAGRTLIPFRKTATNPKACRGIPHPRNSPQTRMLSTIPDGVHTSSAHRMVLFAVFSFGRYVMGQGP
jgi:hypothetical protein